MRAKVAPRRAALRGRAMVSVALALAASAASAHPVETGHGPVGGLLGRVIGAIFADQIAHHEATHSHDPVDEDQTWCEEHQQWESVYEEERPDSEREPEAIAEPDAPVYDDAPDTAGIVVEPPDVLFDPGSSTLSPGAKSRLRRFADSVRARHDLEVVLRGHTDGSPSESDAFTLSEQRAYVVRSFLVEEGVPWRRLRIVGFGDSRPAVTDDTASARQQNRRVEIVLREVEAG